MSELKNIAKRVQNIEISLIKKMPMYAHKLVLEKKWKAEEIVSLGQGIPAMPTPKYIRNAVIEELKSDEAICKYSLQPGWPKLKNLIADILTKKTNRDVNPETEVFVSTGAMEALAVGMSTLFEEGDEVIIANPSYSSHIEQAVFAGAKPVFVDLDPNNNWAFNVEQFKQSINNKTKALILCNPANPTGMVIPKETLDEIVKIVVENNIFVFADETYGYLVFDNEKFISLLEYPELKDLLIYTYSFSKEFAMTGWRVGYMYAPAYIIEQCLKIHDAFVICAPTVSQHAAYAALTGTPYPEDPNMVEVFDKQRLYMCQRLDELPDLFAYQKPKGAYYILAKYLKTGLKAKDFSIKLLEEIGVITIPGTGFGPGGEGHIRLSFCATVENIKIAFDRIQEWNKNL